MTFNYNDKKNILLSSSFLINLGYTKEEDSDSIRFTNENISIVIIKTPCYEGIEVLIKFNDNNEVFNVSWIALVREKILIDNNRSQDIGTLLKYIERNHEKLIDYNYCLESKAMIKTYVNNNKEDFINSINEFLEHCEE